MMIRIILLPAIAFILTGCPNSDELPERVSVNITLAGLEFQSDTTDSLKSVENDVFGGFEHRYAHTDLYFSREGANYNISTGSIGQGVSLSISVGTYFTEGYGGWASPLGSGELTFTVPGKETVIESGSSNVQLEAEPDCALMLVADVHDQLENAFISGDGNPGAVFSKAGDLWYSYFRPQPGFQIQLLKKSGEKQVLDTQDLSIGWIYQSEVLMD